jgi:hypothetical protein
MRCIGQVRPSTGALRAPAQDEVYRDWHLVAERKNLVLSLRFAPAKRMSKDAPS